MPHPAGLPDIFVDRSLGRVQVPQLLRQAGLRLITLAERYGVPADQNVTDERWLAVYYDLDAEVRRRDLLEVIAEIGRLEGFE